MFRVKDVAIFCLLFAVFGNSAFAQHLSARDTQAELNAAMLQSTGQEYRKAIEIIRAEMLEIVRLQQALDGEITTYLLGDAVPTENSKYFGLSHQDLYETLNYDEQQILDEIFDRSIVVAELALLSKEYLHALHTWMALQMPAGKKFDLNNACVSGIKTSLATFAVLAIPSNVCPQAKLLYGSLIAGTAFVLISKSAIESALSAPGLEDYLSKSLLPGYASIHEPVLKTAEALSVATNAYWTSTFVLNYDQYSPALWHNKKRKLPDKYYRASKHSGVNRASKPTKSKPKWKTTDQNPYGKTRPPTHGSVTRNN